MKNMNSHNIFCKTKKSIDFSYTYGYNNHVASDRDET